MAVDVDLIERMYEAAAIPDRWPAVLRDITGRIGARVGVFASHGPGGIAILPSLGGERVVEEYVAEGWGDDPEYARPLLTDLYPGFRAESHYRTREEIDRLPVHVHFFAPRGMVAGVGTIFQGANDNLVQLAFDGLPSHERAEASARRLDALRAPLGRALSLSASLSDNRAQTSVATLQLAGVAAAVVSGDARLRAVNDSFSAHFGARLSTHSGRVRFANAGLQAQFVAALAASHAAPVTRSIAVAEADDTSSCVVHLVPLRRDARDVIGWDGFLLLLALPGNVALPGADLLRLLFDLTPAEARLTRLLVEGHEIAGAAHVLGIAPSTARVHLRRVFQKTGVVRQSELMRLLAAVAAPE